MSGRRLLRNPRARRKRAGRKKADGRERRPVLRPEGGRRAREAIRGWPGYRPAPLLRLPALAEELGIGEVLYKDESGRFGLGSFKALGGAYAVARVLRRAEEGSRTTVACASAGNHGRSVAWGAELFGCRCVVYLPEAVSDRRERAIASHGARVVRPGLAYDAAVRRVHADAEREGWTVVADTARPGYTEIPRDVMEGYTLLVEEALAQADEPPTHVFVQAGVGGLAAAVSTRLRERHGPDRPALAVVEAEGAAALLESARAGARRTLAGPFPTMMGGLACGRPSTLAWAVLATGADFFLTASDREAREAMRRLARGRDGDPPIVAGESGAAGLAALAGTAREPDSRRRLGLEETSRALVIGTEGATDPDAYEAIVGLAPERVGEGRTGATGLAP